MNDLHEIPLLEIENLKAFYHGIGVLHKVSLQVEKGNLVSVIGSNGAGSWTGPDEPPETTDPG